MCTKKGWLAWAQLQRQWHENLKALFRPWSTTPWHGRSTSIFVEYFSVHWWLTLGKAERLGARVRPPIATWLPTSRYDRWALLVDCCDVFSQQVMLAASTECNGTQTIYAELTGTSVKSCPRGIRLVPAVPEWIRTACSHVPSMA